MLHVYQAQAYRMVEADKRLVAYTVADRVDHIDMEHMEAVEAVGDIVYAEDIAYMELVAVVAANKMDRS
jgi:hypothetical protein